ncbi:uncharacterized protein LOC120675201 [Panicum virgatum]|uniref:uncharacterized protein LOC120675201 n=1 Tax=Panicum virgatum TaxID=38727 RepID=UPI0019D6885D|nr:uncharacterized protein LOC120675201 [Panicum virgatum]
MVHVRISCHADLQALQDRSDGRMSLNLLSLESVRIASDSYALLRNLIERRYWRCPQIDLLLLVAGVAVELHKIKHDLFPLVVQEAKLGEGFSKALILLKNSAIALVRLGEEAKEIVKKCVGSLVKEDEFLGKVEVVGAVLKYNVDQVLNGTRKFDWLQSRVPPVLDGVDALLSTPVYFPDSV